MGKGNATGGGQGSNLIPLFVLLEFRLPLSAAGSKVVTPGRGEDGVVLAQAQLRACDPAHTPRSGRDPLLSGVCPRSKALAPPSPRTPPLLQDEVREEHLIHLPYSGSLRASHRRVPRSPRGSGRVGLGAPPPALHRGLSPWRSRSRRWLRARPECQGLASKCQGEAGSGRA